MRQFDFVVIGGGLAGLSTAYHLAQAHAGSVLVVDKAGGAGREASGQNASMICRATEDPLLSLMTSRGADILLGEWKNRIPGLRFSRSGSLFIGSAPNLRRAIRFQDGPRSVRVRAVRLGRSEVIHRYPFLAETVFKSGVFFPDDGIVGLRSLISGLERRLRQMGVRFLYRTEALPHRNAQGLY